MKKVAQTLSILLLLVSVTHAESINLNTAIRRAVAHNRSLTALANRFSEADQRIEQARTSYRPQFRLGANYNYLSRLSEIKLNLPQPMQAPTVKTGTHNMLDANISGAYLLLDFGKRARMVTQAKLGRQLTGDNISVATEEIVYQVIRTYTTATLQTENVNLLQKYVEISKKHVEDNKTKLANGLVSEFDVLKSELQTKVYQEQLAVARIDQQQAVMSLTELCGGDTIVMLEPWDSLAQLEIDWPRTVEFDPWLGQKPQIRALRTQQALSRVAAEAERLRPTLTATSSAGFKNTYMPEPNDPKFNYVGGLALAFPIFDGGFSKHRQQEELEKQRSYQLDIDRILSESRRRIDVLYLEMRKVESMRRLTMEKLTLARKALEIASVSYGVGLITNSDYLDAELEVHSIETQLLKDRYSLLMVQLDIKKELSYYPELTQ